MRIYIYVELLPVGRLSRHGFWMRHLLVLPIAMAFCVAADAAVGSLAGFVAALLTTLFQISVWGRRLHDRGRSAWWLVLTVVPLVGALLLIVECAFLRSKPTGEDAVALSTKPIADYATV